MRHLYFPLCLVAFLGCDGLVGGVCADGYDASSGDCVRSVTLTDPGPAAGGGEPHPTTTSTSTASSGSGGDAGGSAPVDFEPPPRLCFDGLTDCGVACVDLQSDPLHCGGCGHACTTGICEEGGCVGSTPGHVIVLGSSYAQSTVASRRLLGNAVFLPLHEPLRVLELRDEADPAAYSHGHSVIAQQAALRGRTVATEVVDGAEAAGTLLTTSAFDLLLVYDQALATSTVDKAAALRDGLQTHAARGGTVVVLASSPAMVDLLVDTDLLAVTSFASITGQPLDNVAPSSALGLHVPSPFLASPTTSSFELSPEAVGVQVVIATGEDAPVAVHRTTD